MTYDEFLENMEGCPFCDGGNRVIYESEKSILTYALWPYHKHHLLVVPKRHVESLTELSKEEMLDIDMLQEKALETLKKLGYKGITHIVREGNGVNKAVNHVHFHTIPEVKIGDLDHYGEQRKMLSEEDISVTISDVRAIINL